MKKLLTLLLALAMVLCLASCQYLPEGFQSAIDNFMGMFGEDTTCEHDWVDATCTEPKTCSKCGETDGEANGHTEEIVAGTAATCTEEGLTDGKKCSVCGVTTVEQTAIAALGHKEETVAGTAATCTEAGMTDGKKCSVCGVITTQQTAIDALGHKAGEDDGDVTTAVTCERCDYVFVEAKEAITLTIPAFENGAVVADKKNYAIGDTVKLTINPDFGFVQKLTIDGKPLILDWNNNIYSFVAEKDSYVLDGTFEHGLSLNPSDAARWETGNQAHGVLTTYYPANNDSWWMDFNGNYDSLTVTVYNHLPVAETPDNFFVYLRVTMENGNVYLFRIGTDKGGYTAYNRSGIQNPGDAKADWGNWKNLSKLDSKITAEGVEFKVERQGANTLVLTVDGEVVDTYTMNGITAEDKIASVGVKHQGNQGKYVDIPYVLTNGCDHAWVDATCTAPKTCSECGLTMGEKLDHTYMNYVSNNDATCTEDGTKTGTCVCGEKNTIADEGSALGHKEETVVGKAPTCTETGLTDGKKCSVCGVTTVEQNEIPANGHEDDDGDYKCDVCEANLCNDHVEEIIKGKDATCTESGLTDGKKCSICGSVLLAQEIIPASGHKPAEDDGDCTTAVKCANADCDYIFVEALSHNPEADDGDVTTAVRCANAGCEQILVPAKEAIALTIPTFENGAVTADKMNYAIGDTVTLTIAPAGGYFQKLYINGEPLILDWKTFTYSFTATENAYEITGSFENGLGLAPSDWGRWDDHNQLHGVLNTYYPNNNDSWWMAIKGNYNSLTVKVQNQLPIGDTKDNFYVYLRVTMENGNTYNFRIGTDKGGYTAYNRAGIQNAGDASADWGGWKNLSHLDSAVCGDGVDFKVERTAANVLTLSVNGEIVDTYTMNGITAEDKIASIDMKYQGNQGKYVDIPFVLTVPTEEEPPVYEGPVTLNIGDFANGTVTADKDSYNVGDTITLTIAPAGGYFQKLYINGNPLILDWKTFTYSFVATEDAYEITGSFEQGLSLKPGDWGRWDDHNQLHGVLNTYYPSNGDSWWMDINGEYQSVEINAKNLVPKADSMDGNGQNGYMQIIRFGLSNGKTYAFRIYNDKGTYAVSCTAVSGSSSGWGNWKNVANVLGYSIDDAMSGDGVQFKVERTSADTMTVSVNGVVMFTYTMDGVTEADTVTFVGIQSNANSGKYVEIPFELN